jgi:hypothetical protein
MNKNIKIITAVVHDGIIEPSITIQEIIELVDTNHLVILKGLYSEREMDELRESVFTWGTTEPVATLDDFRGNYHMKKAKISNFQQSPHVFHDYNFNDFSTLQEPLRNKLYLTFDSLRIFYNQLTDNSLDFGFIEGEPYLHPQLIQYPNGGGFFGRHNHNLLPQKVGFILSLSKFKRDFTGGGTNFLIDNEVINLEGIQDIGDLVLWKNNLDHWVSQTPLEDWFSWDSPNGRWVATLAYFNPF